MEKVSDNNLKTQLLVLPAHHGDSLIIKTFDKYKNEFNIVIDGGTAKTFDETLKKELRKIPLINILVLSHIDSDHIAGLIKFLKNFHFNPNQVGEYWFNSKNIKLISYSENISFSQAIDFEQLLIEKGEIKEKLQNNVVVGYKPTLPDGIEIEIISPSQEIIDHLYKKWDDLSDEFSKKITDINISSLKTSQIDRGSLLQLAKFDDKPEKSITSDIVNSSSIAFIFKTFDMSVLFLSDSHPTFVESVLRSKGYSEANKLNVDFVKVSHHGSKNNTTTSLLDIIDCDKFIISTNGGNAWHTHPDRETIARILYHTERQKLDKPPLRKIYLNYSKELISRNAGIFVNDEDLKEGNWQLFEKANIFEND
ncbi:ComEC/Rec2 family competence protein [Chryseobacterium luquanense]|uniref:MBL fold metallo-hydrolase n=1 Tax=Chryseobacterium luquanense TaxID=2983766 RepID=A0ABT3Y204_9FLAO|nr:MBL fold metallo-hydrolase [Chryseobacterium luquanense]MCX8532163.1 MBL fold metallo-hydrolase [Chryseobacterium luquanense]